MRADLDITHGLIMAEAVTLALAEFIGKAEAHHHIEALCRRALDRHYPLVDLLAADPQVSQYLSRERLTTLLDPATATGSAERFVRRCWRVIRSNVMNLDYQLDGPDGAPVIVLSNSLGTTRAMWQPQIEALTAHFRVLRYDTHGHGKTTKNGKVTLAQLGEDVIALLDHLNIDRAPGSAGSRWAV